MPPDTQQKGVVVVEALADGGVVEQGFDGFAPGAVEEAALLQQRPFTLENGTIEAIAGSRDIAEAETKVGKLFVRYLFGVAGIGNIQCALKGAETKGCGAFQKLVQILFFRLRIDFLAVFGDGVFLAVDGKNHLGAVELGRPMPRAIAHLNQPHRVFVQLAHGVLK